MSIRVIIKVQTRNEKEKETPATPRMNQHIPVYSSLLRVVHKLSSHQSNRIALVMAAKQAGIGYRVCFSSVFLGEIAIVVVVVR